MNFFHILLHQILVALFLQFLKTHAWIDVVHTIKLGGNHATGTKVLGMALKFLHHFTCDLLRARTDH